MFGADLPGNSQTVQLGQHDIQQNEVIGKASDIVQGALPVGYPVGIVSGLAENVLQGPGQGAFIFNDQYVHVRISSLYYYTL